MSTKMHSRNTSRETNNATTREVNLCSLDTYRSRQIPLENVPLNVWRQVLGLRPFKSSYWDLYKYLWTTQLTENSVAYPNEQNRGPLLLVAAILFAIAAGVPLPIIGIIFGKLINEFPPEEHDLQNRLIQLLVVAIIYFIVTWGWSCCWGFIGERISKRLREELLHKSLGMDLTYYEVKCPDITTRLTADTQSVQLGTSEKTGLFIQSVSYFISAFTVGVVLNSRLTCILFAGVIPPMGLIIILGSKRVSKSAKQASESATDASKVFESSIRAITVVKAFESSDLLGEIHRKYLDSAASYGLKKSMWSAIMLALVFFIAYSANALAFWEGSHLIKGQGDQGAGTIYAVVFLILDASFVIGQFGPFLQTFARAAAAGEKILKIISQEESKISVYHDKGKNFPAESEDRDIKLQNVTFVYPTRPTVKVLEDTNLTFKAGTFTAVVGMSGSGKSTIGSLLLRLYDPTSGKVAIGDTSLTQLNIREYRSHVSLVEQTPRFFDGTIMDNLLHGLAEDITMDDQSRRRLCIAAAEESNAFDFVDALPNGFDTYIGSSGSIQFSGGQQARLALARALVSKPDILLLDEPTAALDANSELLILEALSRTQEQYKRTTIYITHRLGAVQRADNIVVMADAHVLEHGSHDELMDAKGHYYSLVSIQLKLNNTSDNFSVTSASTKIGMSSSDLEKPKIQITGSQRSTVLVTTEKEHGMSIFQILRRCYNLSCLKKWFMLAGLFCSLVTGCIIVGESIIFGHLISALNTTNSGGISQSDVNFYCLMFFVLALIAGFSYLISGICFGILSEHLIRHVKHISFQSVLRQDLTWFENPENSVTSLLASCQTDAGHIAGLSGVIIGTVISVSVSMIGGVTLAMIVAWKVAIVLLAAVPIMLTAGHMRLRILAKGQQRHETAYIQAASIASEACNQIKTVSCLGLENRIMEQYLKALDKPYKESFRFTIFGNLWLALALSITYFVYALAYWWGAKQVRNGYCNTQDFFIILPALLFSAQASGQMFSLAPEFTRAKIAARSIFKLHDQRSGIESLVENMSVTSVSAERSRDKRGGVEFRDVHFTYNSRPENAILTNLSFKIKPGQFIAIVGQSGGGKSSIISLIERFYDTCEGSVVIDGRDIKTVPVKEHRNRISLVSQTPIIFTGSVHFNVSLGASRKVSKEDVVKICKACGLHEFIMGLPSGYETDCGINGSELSGGQIQRLAIARALIRDPDILLFDEATSALDAHSESLVMKAVKNASLFRTTIVVAHRLVTIQEADCIFVMDAGQLVERGNHQQLMNAGGIYATMYKQQSVS